MNTEFNLMNESLLTPEKKTRRLVFNIDIEDGRQDLERILPGVFERFFAVQEHTTTAEVDEKGEIHLNNTPVGDGIENAYVDKPTGLKVWWKLLGRDELVVNTESIRQELLHIQKNIRHVSNNLDTI